MITTRAHRRSLVGAVLGGAALALVLAGCTSTTPDAGGDLKQGDAKTAYADWQDDFHDCMKGKGFDLSAMKDDPTTSSDSGKLDAAASACRKALGNPPADPSVPSAAELNESMLKFAKCMRAAGYDYADPKIDPHGGAPMSPAMPSTWNPADIDRCSKDAGLGGGK